VNLPFFIARRYLVRQKGTFSAFIIRLAIVATALSVAVMVLSVCVISGFKHVIREKLYSFWGHVLVVPYNENPTNIISVKPLNFDPALFRQMSSRPEIAAVTPFVVRPAIIQFRGQMEGIKLKGVGAGAHFSPGLEFSGGSISYADTVYSKDVLLSQTTAGKLDLNAGDSILIYFIESGSSIPRIRKVRVAGLYHTGMEEVDQYLAICDIRLLQQINNWTPEQISGYQLDIRQEDQAAATADYIYNNSELSTQTITDTFPGIIDWLKVQDTTVNVLLIIMSIVATISLGAALLILIVERASITGLLKAIGLNNTGTQRIFLYLAALTGGVGIAAGNIIALSICILQQRYGFLKMSEATYFMDTVPMRINGWYIVLVDLATLAVTVLCMWIPTLYVRRVQPAKVLQFK
jgi:lipoprotein-releasing system permease protein